ncbi:MAG: LysR family transcriptional regulator [Pseudomonadota bacterium]
MELWNELRTALLVAKTGTISGAAAALGVHRATVNRHIDALEARLGAPLFQRHARGYALTEAGRDMLEVTQRADDMFADLVGRSRGRASRLSGELIVTALQGVAPLVMPAIRRLHEEHPEIEISFLSDHKLARLEHGEAHVAVRAGPRPTEPDYIVLPFRRIRFGLYAHRDYLARRGRPSSEDGFDGHRFVGLKEQAERVPYRAWLERHVRPEALSLRARDHYSITVAVLEGLGLGWLAEDDAVRSGGLRTGALVEVIAPSQEITAALWIVAHVDLHRTAKVQALLKHLKAIASTPPLESD